MEQEPTGAGLLGLNGKTGEVLRWLLGLAGAALISYFTAQGAIEQRVTAVETKEGAHFEEVIRRMDLMQTDVRELRQDIKSAVQPPREVRR
jgi:hypothetical protein